MRLPKLEDAIVRSDAEWFRTNKFISEDIYWRVLAWLEGTEDNEVQSTVASWMERDASWIADVESSAMLHFWYVFPVIKLEAFVLKDMLLSRARELRQQEATWLNS